MTAVSVVVTCYNLERYIGEAIRSAIDQRGATAGEIIVVDDCSTDRSANEIRQFADVRYIRTPSNGGVLQAMLLGVAEARHDIICLLDGDDRWADDKLAQTLASFADPAVGLSTHDLRFIDAGGTEVERMSRPRQVLAALPPPERAEAVRRGILELRDYVWLGSALSIRKSTIDWDGFAAFARALPDPANCYQDWPLAYWCAARPGVAMAYVDAPLFDYRLHGANHSGDARDLDKAIRNFRRSHNTVAACQSIAGIAEVGRVARQRTAGRVALAAMQLALYEGRRWDALAAALPAIRGLNGLRQGMKEALRLALGVTLGRSALSTLAARR